jgi:glycerophosphoryl diester phosphodiesterase
MYFHSRAPVLLFLGIMAAIGLLLPATAAAFASSDEPLPQAHAHNDYEHPRPLQDALEHGFTSVEADVWLVDGELLVAHDLAGVQPGRTLESLYLAPLERRVRAHRDSVYSGYDGGFQLLIDVKSDAAATYSAVHAALARHRTMMTTWRSGRVQERAVEAVISGNRDLALMTSQRIRYAGYDGRLPDLEAGVPAAVMPLVSDNWTKYFTWQGVGDMPADQRTRLHALVQSAHDQGFRIRFWATPDLPGVVRENVWRELLAAGVDHLNSDDLPGLAAFLRAQEAQRAA